MTTYLKKKPLITFLVSVLIFFIMTGCQKKSEDFEVFIFSSLPEESKQNLTDMVNQELVGDKTVRVEIFSAMYEKLLVEFIDHSGDVLLMDKELLSSIFDPVGLHPLDDITNTRLKEYELQDEDGDVHMYALPIQAEATLLKDLHYQHTSEVVAIIPKYTDDKEAALKLLEILTKSNGN
ncbi:hypothetical protein [Bacillus sp. AK128]